jgi:hypothetical protein
VVEKNDVFERRVEASPPLEAAPATEQDLSGA